jgi:hypothetical protein
VISVDEVGERMLVAGAQPGDQLLLVLGPHAAKPTGA